ncbi:MAG: VanW family protein [Clostridia bacterium]|nr:VanW family protein [Clostridia bacterium]
MEATQQVVKKRRNPLLIVGIIVLILFLIACGAVGVYAYQILNLNTIYYNIYIDGIDVSQMTKQQAVDKLNELHQPELDKINIRLTYEDDVWEFGYRDVDAKYNTEQVVDEAYKIGRQGNAFRKLAEIYRVRNEGVKFNTNMTYDDTLLEDKVKQISEQVDIEPVDAVIEFYPDNKQKFSISKEKSGQKFDFEKTMNTIRQKLKNKDYGDVELVINPVQPKVFSKDLQKCTHRIVSFSSSLGNSTESRRANVRVASKAFHGKKIDPGQVFSLNETTGERTAAKGYREGQVIIGNKLVDELGGGVCQVSSTLYNAVLMADLEIVERYHHAYPIWYIPKGLDATVYYGVKDFKFKNNRDTPVFLASYIYNNQLNIQVYGEPLPNNREVRLSTNVYATIPAPGYDRIVDKTLKPGQEVVEAPARQGYKVKSYKVIYENGKKVKTELIANDYFKPFKGVIKYNPEKPKQKPDTKKEQAKTPEKSDNKTPSDSDDSDETEQTEQ